MSKKYLRRAVYLVVGCCLAIVVIFVLDTINTSVQYNRIKRIMQKSLEEKDSPRRFTLIATDGVHVVDNKGKKYASLEELQSLDDVSVASLAVLFRVPESSSVDAIEMAHSHFSRLGVVNFFLEYDQRRKHQRISFDESRKNNGGPWDNKLVICGEEVLCAGRTYGLDGESANALREVCGSNNTPVDILCSGETPCGYLMKLIDRLHLKPHRKLYLHILQANVKD